MADHQIASVVNKDEREDCVWELDFTNKRLLIVPNLDQARLICRSHDTVTWTDADRCQLVFVVIVLRNVVSNHLELPTLNLIDAKSSQLHVRKLLVVDSGTFV